MNRRGAIGAWRTKSAISYHQTVEFLSDRIWRARQSVVC